MNLTFPRKESHMKYGWMTKFLPFSITYLLTMMMSCTNWINIGRQPTLQTPIFTLQWSRTVKLMEHRDFTLQRYCWTLQKGPWGQSVEGWCFLSTWTHQCQSLGWGGGAILTGRKEIVLLNPSEYDTRNPYVLNNLIWLVRDKFKRKSDYIEEEAKAYPGKWTLIDDVIAQTTAFHCQENIKWHGNQSFICTELLHLTLHSCVVLFQFQTMTVVFLHSCSWHYTAREFQCLSA